jgi:uncharacterized membrane protein YdjX (TVP38/TMEM64 family)
MVALFAAVLVFLLVVGAGTGFSVTRAPRVGEIPRALHRRASSLPSPSPVATAARTTSLVAHARARHPGRRYEHRLHGGGFVDADGGNSSDSGAWKVALPLVALAGVGVAASTHFGGLDFGPLLEQAVHQIESYGPYGYLYFAAVYVVAEVLAVPALPLTASSGYLFGLIPGFLTVLVSATIAASISFFIGRTFLREWAQNIASSSPRWRAIDTAVGREGFKVILLLRMSPLLPFAISNYLYGLTSVDFGSYLVATFLGFAPGTLGIVYAGSAGKAIFSSENISSLPWYAYLGGGALVLLFGSTVASIASSALQQIEIEEAAEKEAGKRP